MKYIPYSHQHIDAKDIKAVVTALKSDWLTQGPKIKEFEQALCAYTGAKYAVAVSSGTAALHIAALSAGIKKGDEVITSPITFAASANCVLYCGGTPVFADIQKGTVNIDPEEIKITKRTKAIIPVHFAGRPCDLKEINGIAKRHDLIVIEDAAHALGAEYMGEKIGSCRYSDMAIFSFHPLKSITTGEGGAVTTNSKDFYEKLMMYRSHGITKDKGLLVNKTEGEWFHEMQFLGFNYRITDIQAALGLTQLKKLGKFIKQRKAIVSLYNKSFSSNRYFDIPLDDGCFSANHLYPIRLKDKFVLRRADIFSAMRGQGLGVQVHYIPVYLHPYYKNLGFKKGLCPVAEDFYNREISLPIYPGLKREQALYAAKKILGIFKDLEKNA
jgi:UDP-4-amino-4,6-dideoxy-N-acetyl-beta-L-altrosamine transaminase